MKPMEEKLASAIYNCIWAKMNGSFVDKLNLNAVVNRLQSNAGWSELTEAQKQVCLDIGMAAVKAVAR